MKKKRDPNTRASGDLLDEPVRLFEDYELETLREIEKLQSRLNGLTKSRICDLYHEWSGITASASWLMASSRGIKSFVEWATTAPCDMPNTEISSQRP